MRKWPTKMMSLQFVAAIVILFFYLSGHSRAQNTQIIQALWLSNPESIVLADTNHVFFYSPSLELQDVWTLSSGILKTIRLIEVSPNGQWMMVSFYDVDALEGMSLQIWNLTTHRLSGEWSEFSFEFAAWSPDSHYLAIAGYTDMAILNPTGESIYSIDNNEVAAFSLAWGETQGPILGGVGVLQKWNLSAKPPSFSNITTYFDYIVGVNYDATYSRVAMIGENGLVNIYDTQTLAIQSSMQDIVSNRYNRLIKVGWNRDNVIGFVNFRTGTDLVILWDGLTGAEINNLEIEPTLDLAFNSSGTKFLILTYDKQVIVRYTSTGAVLAILNLDTPAPVKPSLTATPHK